MRILTPTENKRLNELIGFVGLSLADPARPQPALVFAARRFVQRVRASRPARGRRATGSAPSARTSPTSSFNSAASRRFCFRSGCSWWRCAGSAASCSKRPWRKSSALRCCSLPFSAEMTLVHVPEVRGALPAGGLLGHDARGGLARGVQSDGREPGGDLPRC